LATISGFPASTHSVEGQDIRARTEGKYGRKPEDMVVVVDLSIQLGDSEYIES
jgi:hypothetical protein